MTITIKGDDFLIDGKPTQLAGNHTWNVVQAFNGKRVSLDDITGNFTRLWTVETRGMRLDNKFYGSNTTGIAKVDVVPWKKTGELNQKFYDRLETVVKRAEKRDIVTGVVLFDHAFNAYKEFGWENHPFNGLGPTEASEIHTIGSWNKYQRAHVKEVVKTLEPYDNVIYEVGNELARGSVSKFQAKVIKWVKKWTDKPVGASYAVAVYRDQSWLKRVGADWIAPSNSARAGGVKKVAGFKGPQVLDTDHAWALTSNVSGLQTAWNDGRSLWLMDGFGGSVLRNRDNLQPDRDFISRVTS
jgi:hypothetical protein